MQCHPCVEAFLSAFAQSPKKPQSNTLAAYRNDLLRFCQYLAPTLTTQLANVDQNGVWDWAVVDGAMVEKFLAYTEQHFSLATLARRTAALRYFFRWLVQQKMCSAEILNYLALPKSQRKSPLVLTREELHKLFQTIANDASLNGKRNYALVSLMYCTGIRVSDALALRWSNIDIACGSVITRGNRLELKQLLQLNYNAIEAVKTYLDYLVVGLEGPTSPEEYVFMTQKKKPLTRHVFWAIVRQYAQQAGIKQPITPHTLRHTRIAHMLQDGAAPNKIQHLVGHTNLAIVKSYLPEKLSSQTSNVQATY